MISRFQFRLATLLRIREHERQQRQTELAQALEAERIIQQQVDEIAAEIALAKDKARRLASPGEIPVDQLLEQQRYGLHLLLQSAAAAEKLGQVRAEAERRRAILVDANRQVRVLEKLREKQSAAFEAALLQAEQKQLDEVANRSCNVPNWESELPL